MQYLAQHQAGNTEVTKHETNSAPLSLRLFKILANTHAKAHPTVFKLNRQ